MKASTESRSFQSFEEAELSLKSGNTESAIEGFRESRSGDPKYLLPWVMELKTLSVAGKWKEYDRTLSEFLKAHPDLEGLPAWKALRKPE